LSIRDTIMSGMARAQRGRTVVPGRYVRGLQLVDVIAVREGAVEWREVNGGATHRGPIADFLARAITTLAAPQKPDAPEVDAVWVVASTKALAADERVAIIAATWPGLVDALPVSAWVADLRVGREPVRGGV
jgi:hypothetical protein